MIRKSNENLLKWIYKYIIDFTNENDVSGLTWESTHKEALKFLHSVPQKERVQRYGYNSTHSHFYLTDSFDDIKEGLEKGLISEETCKIIYRWNSNVERNNWDMDDVKEVLYPNARPDGKRQKFVSNTLSLLKELGLIECINPEAKHGKLFRLTEKGEEIFGEI
ncbi:hypothetical protein [Methanobrevibacter sp.]